MQLYLSLTYCYRFYCCFTLILAGPWPGLLIVKLTIHMSRTAYSIRGACGRLFELLQHSFSASSFRRTARLHGVVRY